MNTKFTEKISENKLKLINGESAVHPDSVWIVMPSLGRENNSTMILKTATDFRLITFESK